MRPELAWNAVGSLGVCFDLQLRWRILQSKREIGQCLGFPQKSIQIG